MSTTQTEFGSIERELHIDASPEVVFEVVSRPEHIREWWSAETAIESTVGSSSELTWRDEASGQVDVVPITVVEVDSPRRFAFRWTHAKNEQPTETNSLLVTFELSASGTGTRLRMVETGFRQQGWEIAKLEEVYNDHVSGWDFYVPRIGALATTIGAAP